MVGSVLIKSMNTKADVVRIKLFFVFLYVFVDKIEIYILYDAICVRVITRNPH